jgi:hypothetical protein
MGISGFVVALTFLFLFLNKKHTGSLMHGLYFREVRRGGNRYHTRSTLAEDLSISTIEHQKGRVIFKNARNGMSTMNALLLQGGRRNRQGTFMDGSEVLYVFCAFCSDFCSNGVLDWVIGKGLLVYETTFLSMELLLLLLLLLLLRLKNVPSYPSTQNLVFCLA